MSDDLTLSSTISASKSQVSCELEEDAVVLGLDDGVYYALNEVAARVWSLLDRPRSVREVRDILMEEYDVTPERCATELLDLLRDLRSHGLLEIDAAAAAPTA